jgi:hypothetical protein
MAKGSISKCKALRGPGIGHWRLPCHVVCDNMVPNLKTNSLPQNGIERFYVLANHKGSWEDSPTHE